MATAMAARTGVRATSAPPAKARSKTRLAAASIWDLRAFGSLRTRMTGSSKSRRSSLVVSSGLTSRPVTYASDPHPMGCPRYQDCKGGAVVRRLARIGANSTILPGVIIGEGALVGAGSVVVHDVPAGAVVAGNPARVMHSDKLTCPPGFFERPYTWPPFRGPAAGNIGNRRFPTRRR